MEDGATYIYVLIDPRNDRIRYVGWCKNLKIRMRRHLDKSKLIKPSHKNNWINLLLRNGYKPEIWPIAVIPYSKRNEIERWWIKYFKTHDYDLTNSTDGGEGALGLEVSEETRRKMSEIMKKKEPFFKGKKHTQETKKKLSQKNRGRKMTEEQREKAIATLRKNPPDYKNKKATTKGRKATSEEKEKMSLAKRGKKQSDEQKEKESKIRQGKKTRSSKNKYVGVTYDPKRRNWIAQISHNKKHYYLGRFATEVEAAKRYNEEAIKLYGENAKLNIFEE